MSTIAPSTNHSPTPPHHGRITQPTPNTSTNRCSRSTTGNFTIENPTIAERWSQKLIKLSLQVEEFRNEVEFLESELHDLHALIKTSEVDPAPPPKYCVNPPSTSPPAPEPKPGDRTADVGGRTEEGEIRRVEAEEIRDSWVYEGGVGHSTFSGMTRDGAAE